MGTSSLPAVWVWITNVGVQVSSNSKVQPAIQMSRECMHAKVLNKLTLWPRLPRVLQATSVSYVCHAICTKCQVHVLCCSAQYALRPYLYLLLHTTVAAPAALWFGSESGTLPVLCSTLMSQCCDTNAHLLKSLSMIAEELIYTD